MTKVEKIQKFFKLSEVAIPELECYYDKKCIPEYYTNRPQSVIEKEISKYAKECDIQIVSIKKTKNRFVEIRAKRIFEVLIKCEDLTVSVFTTKIVYGMKVNKI